MVEPSRESGVNIPDASGAAENGSGQFPTCGPTSAVTSFADMDGGLWPSWLQALVVVGIVLGLAAMTWYALR